MKKSLLILVVWIALSSCGQQISSSTATKEPTLTSIIVSLTPTPNPTPILSLAATPTEWIKTYPAKKALVIYGAAARTLYSSLLIERGDFDFNPYMTLYADGQLIFGPGRYEKQLSQSETEEVLTKLEQSGFFQIRDTYPIDEQNPLYTFPNGRVPKLQSYSVLIELTVNGQESKTIGYMHEWEDYLTQPMKDIVSYLDSFSSDGATPYQPDRLLVGDR